MVNKFIFLLLSGADLNTKTALGRTPLHVAAAQGRGSIVDILLNSGKSSSVTHSRHICVQCGVNVLTVEGRPLARSNQYCTCPPSCLLCFRLCCLCHTGADVNEVDTHGDSALAIAERFGHKDGARHLFLFRWQVRAAQAEKVPQVPLYYHQQCDTANPMWLSGEQVCTPANSA